MKRMLSRRGFLAGLLAAGTWLVGRGLGRRNNERRGSGATGIATTTTEAEAPRPPTPDLDDAQLAVVTEGLERVLPHRGEAVALGTIYLDKHPDERQVKVLLALVAPGGQPAGTRLLALDAPTARARIDRLVRDDFVEGRIVQVGGWRLARTEARLAALRSAIT